MKKTITYEPKTLVSIIPAILLHCILIVQNTRFIIIVDGHGTIYA